MTKHVNCMYKKNKLYFTTVYFLGSNKCVYHHLQYDNISIGSVV